MNVFFDMWSLFFLFILPKQYWKTNNRRRKTADIIALIFFWALWNKIWSSYISGRSCERRRGSKIGMHQNVLNLLGCKHIKSILPYNHSFKMALLLVFAIFFLPYGNAFSWLLYRKWPRALWKRSRCNRIFNFVYWRFDSWRKHPTWILDFKFLRAEVIEIRCIVRLKSF